jgi:omega-6 fatty acid desaturase (delta-12 desaturase)
MSSSERDAFALGSPDEYVEPASAAEWMRALAEFRTPSNARAAFEVTVTSLPFAGAWALAFLASTRGAYWAAIPLGLLASGLLVRLFLIQHDCGHAAFFPSRRINDWLGRSLGVLTLTPYAHWRRTHAEHHATHANLDRRGTGDVDTLTVDEYLERSRWKRWRYRFYRHPIVMFGIGPLYVFLLSNRVPAGDLRGGWRPWVSTMGTNISIVVVLACLGELLGFRTVLTVHVPILLCAALIGVWLFYVQHQFEYSHWTTSEHWTARDAALRGSSHYVLPATLRWFTASIGAHHVHHLSSRIPFYRLQSVLKAHPRLAGTNRLTLRASFSCASLALWDEQAGRMIRFADLRARHLKEKPRHADEQRARSHAFDE